MVKVSFAPGCTTEEMGCFLLSLSAILLLYVAFSESDRLGQYVTTLMRNKNGIYPNVTENLIIPDSQCSALIDRQLLCLSQDVGAVQVEVIDKAAFPDVRIDNSLHNATIRRSAGPGDRCEGEAEVQLSYNCLQSQTPVRQQRSSTQLPPAPKHYG